jgi:hypothetical protein
MPAPRHLPEQEESPSSIVKILRIAGLALVVGGLALMTVSGFYWIGMPLVEVGTGAVMLEVCTDPFFRRRKWVRALWVAVILLLASGFNRKFVFFAGGIQPTSYAMLSGEYDSTITIGGFNWDRRLTDLRVVITNLTSDEYRDVDMTIRPDTPTYRASKLEGPSSCDFKKIPGGDIAAVAANIKGGAQKVTMHPETDDIADDAGDRFGILLTNNGYRLTCDKIPPHSNVELVFALGRSNQTLKSKVRSSKSGERFMELEEWSGIKDPFDFLASKPTPLTVMINGQYTRRYRPFDISQNIDVDQGN